MSIFVLLMSDRCSGKGPLPKIVWVVRADIPRLQPNFFSKLEVGCGCQRAVAHVAGEWGCLL